MTERHYNAKQIAERMGISRSSALKQMHRAGVVKLGRCVVIAESVWNRYVEANRSTPTTGRYDALNEITDRLGL